MSGADELKAEFDKARYDEFFTRRADHLLEVKIPGYSSPSVYITYDFLTRAVYSRTGHGEGGVDVKLFKDIDRDVLEALHAQLKSLGGRPPALPARADENGGLGKVPPAQDGVKFG